LPDYLGAAVIVQPAAYKRRGRKTSTGKPILIVLHTAENGLASGAAWNMATWTSRADIGSNPEQVSSHFVIDASEVIRCVDDLDTAYTQGSFNDLCLSIEHAGRAAYTAGEWAARGGDAMAQLSGAEVGKWCALYGIPARRVSVAELIDIKRAWNSSSTVDLTGRGGITTHADIAAAQRALGESGDHTDPGPGFPIDKIIAIAQRATKTDGKTKVNLIKADNDGAVFVIDGTIAWWATTQDRVNGLSYLFNIQVQTSPRQQVESLLKTLYYLGDQPPGWSI
jgi:hypothetical protein